eukprot:scaffold236833_cov24-Prasinocladus_malaysianus.AAC.1
MLDSFGGPSHSLRVLCRLCFFQAKFGVANDVLDILRAESLSFHEFLEALARVADAIGWPQRQVIGTYRLNHDHYRVSPCTVAGSQHYLNMTDNWQTQFHYNITICKDVMPIRFVSFQVVPSHVLSIESSVTLKVGHP